LAVSDHVTRIGEDLWNRQDAVAKIEGVFQREQESGPWEYVFAPVNAVGLVFAED